MFLMELSWSPTKHEHIAQALRKFLAELDEGFHIEIPRIQVELRTAHITPGL